MSSLYPLKAAIWWGSFLAFPFIVWQWQRLRRGGKKISPIFWLTLSLLFIWSRFIEPQWLRVHESTVSGTGIHADVALISDIHLGVYKGSGVLARAVDRINALPAQAVLIAGDFSYEPDANQLDELLAPLGHLRAPVYAVLGNHDQQAPGPDIARPLRAALQRLGVHIIESRWVDMGGWRLAGLGDNWAYKDDPAFIHRAPATPPTVWLAHNPDSAMRLAPERARLLLAGHTHCGQVRLPWLYRKAIPSRHGFDCGLETARTPRGDVRVFISPGLGEIGLPLRLFNPPTVDWLHLRP
jgi:predicted MPP superfamily phosphohydrolase